MTEEDDSQKKRSRFCIKGVHDLVIDGFRRLSSTLGDAAVKSTFHDTHVKPFTALGDRKPDAVISMDKLVSNVLSHLVYVEVKKGLSDKFGNDDFGKDRALYALPHPHI